MGSRSGPQVGTLYSDNATAVAIFQPGKGQDDFIQACASEVWVTCATWDVTLVVGHIPGSCLADTVESFSRWQVTSPFLWT